MMINLGDGRPDTGDKSTMGSPSKYSYCMGADADTPWSPLHADFGFDPEESCVTVFAADGPRGNNPAGSGSMEFALWVLADSLRNLNPNMIHGGQYPGGDQSADRPRAARGGLDETGRAVVPVRKGADSD